MKRKINVQNVNTNGRVYKVPSMSEINTKAANNKFTAISTFSGCGGSCLGLKMTGFNVLWANEFVKEAQDVYRLNHPDTFLNCSDIRKVTGKRIFRETGLKPGELDLMDGSPPCNSFSIVGKREKNWGQEKEYYNTKQQCDDLFFEYIRLLKRLKPKMFAAENVRGLVTGTSKGYFKLILSGMKAAGYNVKAMLLNAGSLGVPQHRERIIFIGVQKEYDIQPEFPKPFTYKFIIRDALENCPKPIDPEDFGLFVKTDSKLKICYNNTIIGGNFASGAKKGLGRKNYSFGRVKVNPNMQCPTIISQADLFNWDEPRLLHIPLVKRLCGFPDDFKLLGGFRQRWARLGLSVPPLMMKEIGKSIIRTLNKLPK